MPRYLLSLQIADSPVFPERQSRFYCQSDTDKETGLGPWTESSLSRRSYRVSVGTVPTTQSPNGME